MHGERVEDIYQLHQPEQLNVAELHNQIIPEESSQVTLSREGEQQMEEMMQQQVVIHEEDNANDPSHSKSQNRTPHELLNSESNLEMENPRQSMTHTQNSREALPLQIQDINKINAHIINESQKSGSKPSEQHANSNSNLGKREEEYDPSFGGTKPKLMTQNIMIQNPPSILTDTNNQTYAIPQIEDLTTPQELESGGIRSPQTNFTFDLISPMQELN